MALGYRQRMVFFIEKTKQNKYENHLWYSRWPLTIKWVGALLVHLEVILEARGGLNWSCVDLVELVVERFGV